MSGFSPRDWRSIVRTRLPNLHADGAAEADVVEELAQHLSDTYEEARRAGLDEEDAHAAARAELDDTATAARGIRRGLPRSRSAPCPPPTLAGRRWLAGWPADARYACRLLVRSPGVALAAILSLALGIGGNAAVFTVINAALLRPLPYPHADRLVLLGETEEAGVPGNLGFATFEDWRERATGFDQMAALRGWTPTFTGAGEPERLAGLRVSWNFFRTLGVTPALGADFVPSQDRPDRWSVVLLSDGLWRRRFGADPEVIGRTMTLNDRPYTIVGVMAASLEPLLSARFYRPAELWAPLGYAASLPYACRTCRHLHAIGRLCPGTDFEGARSNLEAVQAGVVREHPEEYARAEARMARLDDVLTSQVRPALRVLFGAVAFVLLVACANVANLLLARAANRSREMSVRRALGAERRRIVRQLLTESLVLSLVGGATGLLLGVVGVAAIARLAPAEVPRLDRASIDASVLLFTLGISVAAGIAFGLAPALRMSSMDLRGLHHDARGAVGATSWRTRKLLVAADLAIAIVLLVGAGLMIRTVSRLLAVDPGFDPSGVATLRVSLVGERYEEDRAVVSAVDRVLERVGGIPGVESVAAASQVPLGGDMDMFGMEVQGRVLDNPEDAPNGERYSVSPDYLRVMRLSLRRGRFVEAADTSQSMPVMVLSDAAVRVLFPGQDPLGERIRIGGDTMPWRAVVGVVGDVRHYDLATAPTPQFYLPEAQSPAGFLTLVVRTSLDPAGLTPAMRRAIRSVDPNVPIYEVAPLEELVRRSAASRRFVMVLLALFASLAVVMAMVGVYGVTASLVSQRVTEYGLRMALGASRAEIFGLVLRRGLPASLAGLLLGTAAAFALARTLERLLFGVVPTDRLTFGTVGAGMFVVALAAHALPALRATRVDPAVALRDE